METLELVKPKKLSDGDERQIQGSIKANPKINTYPKLQEERFRSSRKKIQSQTLRNVKSL